MHGPANTDKIATELKKLRGILRESYIFTILNVKQPATMRSELSPFVDTKKKGRSFSIYRYIVQTIIFYLLVEDDPITTKGGSFRA